MWLCAYRSCVGVKLYLLMRALGIAIKNSRSVQKLSPYIIVYHHSTRLIKTVTMVVNVSLWSSQLNLMLLTVILLTSQIAYEVNWIRLMGKYVYSGTWPKLWDIFCLKTVKVSGTQRQWSHATSDLHLVNSWEYFGYQDKPEPPLSYVRVLIAYSRSDLVTSESHTLKMLLR